MRRMQVGNLKKSEMEMSLIVILILSIIGLILIISLLVFLYTSTGDVSSGMRDIFS